MSVSLRFFERPYPSANMIIIQGKRPVLVDSGFGSDLCRTESLLCRAGVRPEDIQFIVNTHYHSDHTGGNSGLQKKYGLAIAAHRWEGQLVNDRHREACCAHWLKQPVEPYQVLVLLEDGDEINTGDNLARVCHTPGHTMGHISIYLPNTQELICGDMLQANDVGWINIFREGVCALQVTLDSLEKLDRMPLRLVYPGHGPVIAEPRQVISRARKRLEKWLTRPKEAAWHACKRIFAYALMINGGLPRSEISRYLLYCGWFIDFCTHVFRVEPADLIQPLLDEMIRTGAGYWRDEHLLAGTPYISPGEDWNPRQIAWPEQWPYYRTNIEQGMADS